MKPSVKFTDKYTENFLEEQKEANKKRRSGVDTSKQDRLYLTNALEALVRKYEESGIVTDKKVIPQARYSPRAMFDGSVRYLRETVAANQPLTITGLGLFLGLWRNQIWKVLRRSDTTFQDYPEYAFIFDFASYIEMYNEYAAHKKQNPAGPIFILKNFGWKDKFEIEATSVSGAMTEEEREAAQRRILQISEGKVNESFN